ncbi:hypothetical protein ACFFK0_15795 [Paenibacillus chartarius]|uniref:Uncharacterized protein n=1 Tax=Paenibacillus chartarius TaxID=747481 RepID=A0ABV6DML5_9BACL
MIIKKLVFGCCDHEGDLDAFVWEVVNSGGLVAAREWDAQRKIGAIEVVVENEQAFSTFMEAFKQTNSSTFLRDPK